MEWILLPGGGVRPGRAGVAYVGVQRAASGPMPAPKYGVQPMGFGSPASGRDRCVSVPRIRGSRLGLPPLLRGADLSAPSRASGSSRRVSFGHRLPMATTRLASITRRALFRSRSPDPRAHAHMRTGAARRAGSPARGARGVRRSEPPVQHPPLEVCAAIIQFEAPLVQSASDGAFRGRDERSRRDPSTPPDYRPRPRHSRSEIPT